MRVAFLTTDNRDQFKDYGAPAPCFGPAPEALLQGFALLPELEIHVVACARAEMRSPEKLAPNVFFHCLIVPKLGWMRTLFQGCILSVRKKLKEIQPDLVHGQGTEGHNSLAAVFSGFPNVCTIHGNMRLIARLERPNPLSYNWLAARLESFTIPRSLGIVCITHHTKSAVTALARRTWVVPNAVDPSFFQIQPHATPNALPRILCVGRVCPLKNQNALIQALDPLATRRKFELVFVGNVNENEPYGAEFSRLVDARPWCRRAGFADREDLKAALSEATLLALTSLEENCPMVILEAMAAGVPVVAAKVGGVPDLIEEDKTGWFCDPRDRADMRAGIEKVLANPPRMTEVAGLAKLRAHELFHPKVVAQRHIEIYHEILRDSKPIAVKPRHHHRM
ncbi:MAG TPA: glycosyltransferase family 4 protein [Candidatus Binatia bacterium]|jgi:glycosyltransferase involved in cell wall biosynthesis|nr:glycosyltransferase family 4 protein [Candidatus Binatia bacterium]